MERTTRTPAKGQPSWVKKYVPYGIGSLGVSTLNFMAMSFVMVYFTDVMGVAMGTVSLMVLIVRIFDAVNDPLIGMLADRSNSRMGRYRPWILFGGIGWAVFVLLMFSGNPQWSVGTKVLWMYVMYIMATVCGTCCFMSYSALNSVMSGDGLERGRISMFRSAFNYLGTLITSVVFTKMISDMTVNMGSRKAYITASIILGVLSIATFFITSLMVKEEITVAKEKAKLPLSVTLGALFKNSHMIMLFLGMIVWGMANYSRYAMMAYYFPYYCNDGSLLTWFNLLSSVMNFVGAFLVPLSLKLFKSKGKACGFSMIFGGLCIILCQWAGGTTALFWICVALSGIACGLAGPLIYAMSGDVIDYGEYKNGVRCDGFLSSMSSFGMKAGGAIGPALFGAVLASVGYIANQEQTPLVLNTLNTLSHVVIGGLALLVGLVFMFGYKLSIARHAEIRAALDAGNAGRAES